MNNLFCINCNHFDQRSQLCVSPSSIRHVNPVSGKTFYESATIMRANQSMCGTDATLFVPIDTTVKPSLIQRMLHVFK
jgi:hypothetical protein